VDADPDPRSRATGPAVTGDALLHLDRGAHGGHRVGEGEGETVAIGRDLDAPMPKRGLTKEPEVLVQHLGPPVTQRLEGTRRPLHVREDERDRPRGQWLGAHGSDYYVEAGNQNSSWIPSGSRNTITVPIGVSAIGE